MLDFEKELERYKPALDIDEIQIDDEEFEDLVDVFKTFQRDLSQEDDIRKEG